MNAEALIGTVLGTCTLERLVGQGGMGAVFLAQQSRPRRQVAVKVLLPATSLTPSQQAAFLERFRRETDAAASLEHPNIMPVHEYGERDGLAYLVMPYISGGTLRDELEREGQLPLAKAMYYLEQIAAALDTAHAHGVIHRDIKPANILITPDGRLLLTDFGLVKIAAGNSDGRAPQVHLTAVGVPIGTPDYMAPEQVIGGEVDARADLYSLGIILYQMITGTTPFKGEMPMQVAMQHLHVPPQSPRILRPDLPLAAEQVMLRTLAKRPADRYMHAQDLAGAFRLALTMAGVPLLGDSPTGMLPAFPPGGTESRIFTRRGLFDPVWQSNQANGKQRPDAVMPGADAVSPASRRTVLSSRNDIVAKTSMPLPSMSGILPPMTASASPVMNNQQELVAPTNNTPPPPTRPRLGHKPGLLRAMGNADKAPETFPGTPMSSPVSAEAFVPAEHAPQWTGALNNTGLLSFAGGTDIQPSAATNADPSTFAGFGLQQMAPNGSASTGINAQAPGAANPGLSASAGIGLQPSKGDTKQFNPASPLPPMGTTGTLNAANNGKHVTGALFAPSTDAQGQETTGMVKLTQSVKVVKVPIAGQPGRYMTGLLPITPTAPEPASSPAVPFTTMLRLPDDFSMEKYGKKIALVVAAIIILLGSSIFWLARSHSHQSMTPGVNITQTKATPDLVATASLKATATAQANTILTDPLEQNTHDWPVFTKGAQISVFKDGAYYITDNDTRVSATALLAGETLKDFAYTLSLQEVQGDETSVNNEFGMLLRYSTHQKGGKTFTTFYAFEVTNADNGGYQFLKYDDSFGGNPWTAIWSHPYGHEFYAGHGAKSKNTFKVFAKGTNFVFVVNGKQVGTAQDNSLKDGQIGMLVNMQGTEVAFSDLLLTYN